ncbi:MAG: DUF3750 domain-containing protein, partial [Methyloligellaceae bacterium]
VAPSAESHPAPILQVYAARAFSWRGAFAVHTWVAAKPRNAKQYTVYEVIGWRVRSGLPALVIHTEEPDRYWFGNAPEVIADIRGDGVDDAIRRLDAAARSYPYRDTYTVWPGPNSNTFTAWVGRSVPELKLDLPSTAVGKDWLDGRKGQVVASAPSGTGYQFSVFGVFGVLAGVEEGLEINLAGLTLGIDPLDLALKLPGFGRIGGLTTPSARADIKSAGP